MISMEEDQNQCPFPASTISTDHSSSLACSIRPDTPQDQGQGGNHPSGEKRQAQGSSKWMSSKMRLMKKMMGADQIIVKKQRRRQPVQDQAPLNHPSGGGGRDSPSDALRACCNCKTTRTPLWRSGPQGPKSLCNACGIRQMKARRAMRAAAAAGLGADLLPATNCEGMKGSGHVDRTIPFKKRFKIVASASAQEELGLDDITVSLSKKLGFHQAFPQEEKDAAILLMALSCGLIHG